MSVKPARPVIVESPQMMAAVVVRPVARVSTETTENSTQVQQTGKKVSAVPEVPGTEGGQKMVTMGVRKMVPVPMVCT